MRCTRIPTVWPELRVLWMLAPSSVGTTDRWQPGNSAPLGPPITAWLNSRWGWPAVVNVANGALTCATGQAWPSLVNGSDVQLEDRATRASISGARLMCGASRIPNGVSRTNWPDCRKCPMNPRLPSPWGSIHDTYGTLPKNVMSGLSASRLAGETGAPPLNSSKWSPPTRRETKTECLPDPLSSDHTTHGTVGLPGTSVPDATRGSSALLAVPAFSEHAFSALVDAAQAPKPLPEVSKTFVWPAVPLPTACQWKAPSALASATILAANTCSLSLRP